MDEATALRLRHELEAFEAREPGDAIFRKWLLDGLRDITKGGKRASAAVVAATSAFLLKAAPLDPVSRFVAELCETDMAAAATGENDFCERTVRLFERFRQWRGLDRADNMTLTAFGRKLGKMGFAVARRRNSRTKARVGIRLKAQAMGRPALNPPKELPNEVALRRFLETATTDVGADDHAETSAHLYKAFLRWCSQKRVKPMGVSAFGRELGKTMEFVQGRIGRTSQKAWRGIRLRPRWKMIALAKTEEPGAAFQSSPVTVARACGGGADIVGQWSGGVVPSRGEVITGHWLG